MSIEEGAVQPEDAKQVIQELEAKIADLKTLTKDQRAIIGDLLERLSRDPMLMGLYSSRGFRDKARELISGETNRRSPGRADQLAVVLIDVNKFKDINDTYGHEAGDRVLEALAEILTASRRDEDVVARLEEESEPRADALAGRLGGDEFAIALPGADEEGARKVLERIKQVVGERVVKTKKGDVTFSVSGGIAVFKDGMDVDGMLDRADEEMYKDKKGEVA